MPMSSLTATVREAISAGDVMAVPVADRLVVVMAAARTDAWPSSGDGRASCDEAPSPPGPPSWGSYRAEAS